MFDVVDVFNSKDDAHYMSYQAYYSQLYVLRGINENYNK